MPNWRLTASCPYFILYFQYVIYAPGGGEPTPPPVVKTIRA
jgi:hypothetical protein